LAAVQKKFLGGGPKKILGGSVEKKEKGNQKKQPSNSKRGVGERRKKVQFPNFLGSRAIGALALLRG
jgi:hypothetical protein